LPRLGGATTSRVGRWRRLRRGKPRLYGDSHVLTAATLTLHLPNVSGRVKMLSPFSRLVFSTQFVCVMAAVYVQLKAVGRWAPQYLVFYYLTRPRIRR